MISDLLDWWLVRKVGFWQGKKILNEEDALEEAAKQGNSPKRWEILADHWGKRLWRLVLGEREEAMRMASGGEVFLCKLCS